MWNSGLEDLVSAIITHLSTMFKKCLESQKGWKTESEYPYCLAIWIDCNFILFYCIGDNVALLSFFNVAFKVSERPMLGWVDVEV